MPHGMYLRSASDWYLDADDEHTIEKFTRIKKLATHDVEPLSLRYYLSYVDWYIEQKRIDPLPVYIERLDYEKEYCYRAVTNDGETIYAKNVAIAVGLTYFKYIPAELAALLPPRSFSHTCETTDMTQMEGKKILIVGGRQSAYEWAALLNEAGAASVDISHRHASPAFKTADWSWVNAMVDRYENEPLWFHDLSEAAKEDIRKRLWAEGRLKIEPWLEQRIKKDNIRIWPCTQIVSARELQNSKLEVLLDNGERIIIDHIIFATGYSVNIHNVPFLASGNILPLLSIQNNYPVLDEHLQTNLPGLFITSMPATHDFGPFFGFTIAVRASAKLIARCLTGSSKK